MLADGLACEGFNHGCTEARARYMSRQPRCRSLQCGSLQTLCDVHYTAVCACEGEQQHSVASRRVVALER